MLESESSKSDHSLFVKIPDSIVEHDILTFLNSKDLFYSVRGVCTEWQELMRNVWSGKIKDEMIDQVKSLDFIYEKEVFTKTYEFKMKYLLNYRNLLSAYNINANILLIVKTLLPLVNNIQIKDLLKIFFAFTELTNCYVLLLDGGSVEELDEFLMKDEIYLIFRMKMMEFLDIEKFSKDQETLNLFKSNFNFLNKSELENLNENAKLVYSFLQGLIEFEILKFEVKELRMKIENLILRIQEETLSWPKKKKFFEKAYKFILFSKSSNSYIKMMMSIYEQNRIKHPLIDYNDEALQLIYDLKNKLNFGYVNMENIDEIIFDNILSRRILLTKKLLILEKFYSFYNESNKSEYIINEEKMSLRQLLWCMKFSSNSENENITKESILKTKSYLDLNFDYENHVIYASNYETQYTETESEKVEKNTYMKKNQMNPHETNQYTQNDIDNLKKEKERLISQKEKTEEILAMIKKFITLKEHMASNKNKYKLILYILTQVRAGDGSASYEINLDHTNINNILQNIDIDSLNFDDNNHISQAEKNELSNFDISEALLKDIEESIAKQIEIHLMENKHEDL